MLITNLKDSEYIASLIKGKTFIINCFGCKEVYFPEQEASELQKKLHDMGKISGILTTDYICNRDNLSVQLEKYSKEISAAECILVFSCGVGVQTVADFFDNKIVYSACDTLPLPGSQGLTPQEYDCGQCGECYLNLTGGVCPITACSKSLVNGPCGGAKDGMCEVDHDMECGWVKIYRRLKQTNRLDVLKCPVQIRNYATDIEI